MKKILFLLLPFIWQCNTDSFFEPANLGSTVISPEVSTKIYSIHSSFDEDNLGASDAITTAYKSPIKSDITDERYVFYGKIHNDRDAVAASLEKTIYILFEIRNVDGKIKVNSAHSSRRDGSKPLDLYNARTELPTVVTGLDDTFISIGFWPEFSKLTHANLATTNTSRFNYVSILQSKLYTNIVSGSYSFLKAGSTIGNTIDSSASIASLKQMVSGHVWNSVQYPSLSPTSTSYYFNPDSTLNTSSYPTPPTTATLNYYGWDIWTYNGFDKVEGAITEHYLYTYRAPKMVYNIVSTTGGEEQFLLRFVFTNPKDPIASTIVGSWTFANLIRLSIAP